MKHLSDDSALSRKIIDMRHEVLKAMCETVTADRLSIQLGRRSTGAGRTWTAAAQRRDAELEQLKELLEKCAKGL